MVCAFVTPRLLSSLPVAWNADAMTTAIAVILDHEAALQIEATS